MAESKSDDCLPPGWTMKIKVRNDGRKDKYYYAPSNGPTFNSWAEVLRYLGTSQINPQEATKKNKGTLKHSEKAVVVEKGKAEGLPPGWIKEIRVRKRANSIRRDPYYIDPVSKSVFRSLKAVFRYLETEELGTLVENSEASSDKELEDDKTYSTGVMKKQQLAVGRTRRQIKFGQSSDMNEIEEEEQMPYSSSQSLPPSEDASEQCEGVIELSNSDMQETRVFEQKQEEGDSSKSTLVPTVEVLSAKKSLEDVLISREHGKVPHGVRKSKKKKVPDLPRRASKRLAGLEVDLIPELKPRTRARRGALKESDNGVTGTDEGSSHGKSSQCAIQQPSQLEIEPEVNCTIDTSKNTELSRKSKKLKHFSENLVKSEKQFEKVEAVISCDEKHRISGYPLESQNKPYEHKRNVETDDNADEKHGVPLDLPFGELLTDPCIAFAIKTLTGINFNTSESSEVMSGSISSDHSLVNLASEPFKQETENKADRKQGRSGIPPSVNIPISEDPSETEAKADAKSGSSIELPYEGSWQDPCIEFAIKTLTDAIPLDYDPNIQQYFQQQLSSSKTRGSDDTSLASVGLDNFSQSDLSSRQQFCDVEQPVPNQQLQVGPAFPQSRTLSLKNACQSVRNQCGNERQ